MGGNGDCVKMTAEKRVRAFVSFREARDAPWGRFSVTHDHRSILSQVLQNGQEVGGNSAECGGDSLHLDFLKQA